MTYRNREYDLHQRQKVTIVSLRKVKELNSINPSDSNGCANRCKGRRMVRLPDELHPALVLLAPALRIEGIKLDLCDIIVDGGLQGCAFIGLAIPLKKDCPLTLLPSIHVSRRDLPATTSRTINLLVQRIISTKPSVQPRRRRISDARSRLPISSSI